MGWAICLHEREARSDGFAKVVHLCPLAQGQWCGREKDSWNGKEGVGEGHAAEDGCGSDAYSLEETDGWEAGGSHVRGHCGGWLKSTKVWGRQ